MREMQLISNKLTFAGASTLAVDRGRFMNIWSLILRKNGKKARTWLALSTKDLGMRGKRAKN
jgi:hypothetical protein